MTHRHFLKKIALQKNDFDRIAKKVAEVEKKTNGEIALAITSESNHYILHELVVALIAGIAVFALMIPFTAQIAAFLDSFLWHFTLQHVTAFFGLVSLAVMIIVFYAANIPCIDRLIIPQSSMRKAVYNRAVRYFIESGVYQTEDDSGILIFISYLEKEVRIIADSGIIAKIPQEQWDDIATSIAAGFKQRQVCESIIVAVESCGKILAEHFPHRFENPNELSDGLVVLEGGN